MKQPKNIYSVLIIEDNPSDQVLLEENLKSTGLSINHIAAADTLKKAKDLLQQNSFSIIFLDLFLPDSSGLDSVTQLVGLHPEIPVIISSGLSDTQTAVDAISLGAQDFLIKGDYSVVTLEKTIRYSIERKDAELLIKASEERYRYLFDNNPVAIFIWELDTFKILEVNEAAANVYGYTRDEFSHKTVLDLREGNDPGKLIEVKTWLRNESHYSSGLSRHLNNKGEVLIMDISSHLIILNKKEAVLALANDVTQRILLEEKLAEEKIKKQQEITAAVITAQAGERSLLGEELHDNINQILATASLYLDCAVADEGSRINYIKDSKQFVKTAIEEIRKLSKSLLPPSLGEAGLQEALKDAIDNIKRVNDRVEFIIDWQLPDENVFSEKLKLNIFRIVQEQLNNIFKHAKASRIIISLKEYGDLFELGIKDDGVGFDISKKREGIGLQNISKRAEVLNGSAAIHSTPGHGCEVLIHFPLEDSITGVVRA